jgi:hypothetical protein
LCQVLDQLKADVDKIKKQKNSTTLTISPAATTDELVIKLNENLINPVNENFEVHVIHTIQCTQ